MKKQIEIIIPPQKLGDKVYLHGQAAVLLNKNIAEINAVIPVRRSIDARSKYPVFRIMADVYVNENISEENLSGIINYSHVTSGKKVIIAGCGPGGMFAALRLIELGIKPVIVERGKDVQARRRDLKAIQQDHIVNPDSNYCFGEGGAGTYSDGKLYTRAVKRGNVKKMLSIFVQHGAHEDILIDAHPHIGSNKLPGVVKAMRETILRCGGEILFNSRITDFILNDDKIKGVVVNNSEEILGDAVILATGHSARDIFYLLHKRGITIEQKSFAMGVRIEHPQELINEIQYHTKTKHENLPAASYSLACEINGRGVYSFCMCPGGIIVPASTAPGELVVNGMSLSRRDSKFANSGYVVSVDERQWKKFESANPFAGLKLQQELEKISDSLVNSEAAAGQKAPAQRVVDFVQNKVSSDLPVSSYIPGIVSSPLHDALPAYIARPLKQSLLVFDKKMRGYYTNEAVIVATESRTSSPVRVPRDKESLMHIKIKGLFPCGEGAGYAGGIISAAIDGENCADASAKYINL
jgi:uncharacterized FAD-dependent dehydrogenase